MQFMTIGEGLQCADADSTTMSAFVSAETCAFNCLLDADCQTFSWAENGYCKLSDSAAQCSAEVNSTSSLYLLTECAFFEKGSETEIDVFHAIVPSNRRLFGAVAPFNFFSTVTEVEARTAWEDCDPGSLFSVASDVANFEDYCAGDWSADLAATGITEVALCYDAAVADSANATAVQMVLFGDDGSCYYTTAAKNIGPDAACVWVMESAVVLTSGLGIEFAPPGSTVTTLWDGTCKHEGGDPNLHVTCAGPAGCSSGWEGILCDTDVDDCASFPCEDHLDCFDLGTNAFECRCVGGWGGMCTQPLAFAHRQAISHAKYCFVAEDVTCAVFTETLAFATDFTSLDVCKNYCSNSDWCTHLVSVWIWKSFIVSCRRSVCAFAWDLRTFRFGFIPR